MKAIVVYESHWGNTAAVARAIAAGIGSEAEALSTAEATAEVVATADLVVAGAPLMAFRLPTDKIVDGIWSGADEPAADRGHPTMRTWLAGLPGGRGAGAAFETKLRWSPGGATAAIEHGLGAAGYRRIGPGHKFVVEGRSGPLRDGELERARAWGAELGAIVRQRAEAAVPA
jgi:hypothetical protein